MKKAGFFQRLISEALPFVARSSEMKVNWLVNVFEKKSLICCEIAPYMHLLLSEYENEKESLSYSGVKDNLKEIFLKLSNKHIITMITCTDIYDVPTLLDLVPSLAVDEAVLILQKSPPLYEKKPLILLDSVFQAVHFFGDNLLLQAAERMRKNGDAPSHFESAFERYNQIIQDEEVLISLYPQAKR